MWKDFLTCSDTEENEEENEEDSKKIQCQGSKSSSRHGNGNGLLGHEGFCEDDTSRGDAGAAFSDDWNGEGRVE